MEEEEVATAVTKAGRYCTAWMLQFYQEYQNICSLKDKQLKGHRCLFSTAGYGTSSAGH